MTPGGEEDCDETVSYLCVERCAPGASTRKPRPELHGIDPIGAPAQNGPAPGKRRGKTLQVQCEGWAIAGSFDSAEAVKQTRCSNWSWLGWKEERVEKKRKGVCCEESGSCSRVRDTGKGGGCCGVEYREVGTITLADRSLVQAAAQHCDQGPP